MKKLVLSLVVGAFALTGVIVAPTAFAQAPTCSQAQLDLAEAERLHDEAVTADKALAEAEAKDKSLDDAKDAAQEAARAEGQPHAYNGPLTDAAADELEARPNPSENDKKTAALIRAYLAAEKAAQDFVVPQAVRTTAAASDADALKVKLAAAVEVAGEACKGDPVVVFFASCADARAAGVAPINANQPGYRLGLDTDRDGIACEPDERTQIRRTPTAINTGVA